MALTEAGKLRVASRVRHDEDGNIGPTVITVWSKPLGLPRLEPHEIEAFDKAIELVGTP